MCEAWVTGQRIKAVADYFAGQDSCNVAKTSALNLGNNTFVWSLDHYLSAPPPAHISKALEVGAKILGKSAYAEITSSTVPPKFVTDNNISKFQIRKFKSSVVISGNKSIVSVAQAVRQLTFPGDDAAGIARSIKRIKFKDGCQPIKIISDLVGEDWCRARSGQLTKTAAALANCKR